MDRLGEIVAFIFTFLIRAAVKAVAVLLIGTGLLFMYNAKVITLPQSVLVGLGLALFEINGNVSYTPEKR
jgi:hypothetical protein